MDIVAYEHQNEEGEDLLLSLEQDALIQALGVWPCDSEGVPFTNRAVLEDSMHWPDLHTEGLLSLLGVS